MSALDDDLKNS